MGTKHLLPKIEALGKQGLILPEAHGLAKLDIEWDVFAGVTILKPTRIEDRTRACFTLFRNIASEYKIHFLNLKWILRHEIGTSGVPHVHFLLEGLPNSFECARIKELCVGKLIGTSHFDSYDASRGGFTYIFKRRGTGSEEIFIAGARHDLSYEIQFSNSLRDFSGIPRSSW